MPDLAEQILTAVAHKSYHPLKARALARKLNVPTDRYRDFRRVLRELIEQHRIEIGRNQTLRAAQPHGTVTGVFRKTAAGFGFVRPHLVDGQAGPEILIREADVLDASTGDT